VTTFLGLLGLAGFIVAIVSLAAGVTWTVVRYSPTSDKKDAAKAPTTGSS
jgi:hypothetical protein